MKVLLNVIQFVALGVVSFRADGDIVTVIATVAFGLAAFEEGRLRRGVE